MLLTYSNYYISSSHIIFNSFHSSPDTNQFILNLPTLHCTTPATQNRAPRTALPQIYACELENSILDFLADFGIRFTSVGCTLPSASHVSRTQQQQMVINETSRCPTCLRPRRKVSVSKYNINSTSKLLICDFLRVKSHYALTKTNYHVESQQFKLSVHTYKPSESDFIQTCRRFRSIEIFLFRLL